MKPKEEVAFYGDEYVIKRIVSQLKTRHLMLQRIKMEIPCQGEKIQKKMIGKTSSARIEGIQKN
jgi:hypothetical protein